jgi:hypothetical protein
MGDLLEGGPPEGLRVDVAPRLTDFPPTRERTRCVRPAPDAAASIPAEDEELAELQGLRESPE